MAVIARDAGPAGRQIFGYSIWLGEEDSGLLTFWGPR